MKHSTIICFILAMTFYTVQSQIPIDDALLNKSEMLKQKRGGAFSGNVHKTAFGPFKIVDIHKGKQHLAGRQTETYISVKGKDARIKKGAGTLNSQPFSLTIVQEGADTIISNMELITVKGGNHALIEVSSGKGGDEESSVSHCADLVIQVRSDSLDWHMPQNDDQEPGYNDFPVSFDRVITNGVDKILVKEADGFPVKAKLFKNSTQGIVFLYNKKQVAALETYPETSIWFSNDINERHKQVIAAVMISLLSIFNRP